MVSVLNKPMDLADPASDDPQQTRLPTLRLLMVTARFIPLVGGTEVHTHEVARRLAALGHQVTVLTTNLTGKLPPTEILDGIEVVRVPVWPTERDFAYAPQLRQVIVGGNWDLVHCQGYHTLVAPQAMAAARRSATPYVVSFHSGGHSSRLRNAVRYLQHLSLRPLLAHARKLIAVSDFEADYFQKRLRLPRARFVTISNGSHLPKATGASTPREGTLIVSMGRLERFKGHHRIIAALPEVAKQIPDVRLRIIGSGPYETELRQLAERCGVADRVEIGPVAISERAGLASILSQAKLLVLLSDYESQGIAVLEALSLGVPALVTHASGLAEFANKGYARAVPLDSSPAQVAAAVIEQVRNPLIAPDIVVPTWDQCAAQLLDLYYEVSSGHHQLGMPGTIRPPTLKEPSLGSNHNVPSAAV